MIKPNNPNPGRTPAPNPEQTQFLAHCYNLIQEQQQHIGKLEADIARKDSIIANLINRSQGKGTRVAHRDLEQQENEAIMQEYQCKLGYMQGEIRRYQGEIREKEVEMDELRAKLREAGVENQMLRALHEESKDSLVRIKEVYELKIQKLLAEIRKKVQEDIQKTREKSIDRHQSPLHAEPGTERNDRPHYGRLYSNTSNTKSKETPVKSQHNEQDKKYHYLGKQYSISSIQVSEELGRVQELDPVHSSVRRGQPINQKQKALNFVGSKFKPFPSLQAIQQQNKNQQSSCQKPSQNRTSIARMLKNVKDVHFASDLDSSYENQNEESDASLKMTPYQPAGSTMATDNQKTISISKLLQEFNQQQGPKNYINYQNESALARSREKFETPDAKKSKASKIIQILSNKIKEFQAGQSSEDSES